jgi:hypothetical protein
MQTSLLYPPAAALQMDINLPYGLSVLAASLRRGGTPAEVVDLNTLMRSGGRLPAGILPAVLAFHQQQARDGRYSGTARRAGRRLADRLLEVARVERADLVGIGVTSYFQIATGLLLAQRIKERHGCPVVVGGPFVTLHADLFFGDYPFLDYAIVGDGEVPVRRLMERLSAGGPPRLAGLPSLWYREGGEPRFSGRQQYEIEQQSCPDFDGLPLELYRRRGPGGRGLLIPYAASRGCKNRCSFCAHHGVNGAYQHKSVDKVLDDLAALCHRYQSRHVVFEDPNFNLSRSFAGQLCEGLLDRGLGLRWIARLRGERFDEDLCRKMRDAGCYKVRWGIESGSDRVLRSMGKPSIRTQERALVLASRGGIKNSVYLVVNYPHETAADLRSTEGFLRRNRDYIDEVSVYPLGIRRGSALHDRPAAFGIEVRPRPGSYLTFDYGFTELGPSRSRRQAARLARSRQRIIVFCLRRIKPKSYRFPFNVAVGLLGPAIQRAVSGASRWRGTLRCRLLGPALAFASRHL